MRISDWSSDVLLFRSHLRPQRTLRVGECPDQAEVERGIGHRVDDRRSGSEYPVLHPQVRNPVRDVIDRPVPAIDGAVVQAQLREDRKSVVWGKSVSVRVDPGGRGMIKKKTKKEK